MFKITVTARVAVVVVDSLQGLLTLLLIHVHMCKLKKVPVSTFLWPIKK